MTSQTVTIMFNAPSINAEEETAAFWRAVDASGIPHTTEDPADFGVTAITTTWDHILQIEAIAAQYHGFIEKWA